MKSPMKSATRRRQCCRRLLGLFLGSWSDVRAGPRDHLLPLGHAPLDVAIELDGLLTDAEFDRFVREEVDISCILARDHLRVLTNEVLAPVRPWRGVDLLFERHRRGWLLPRPVLGGGPVKLLRSALAFDRARHSVIELRRRRCCGRRGKLRRQRQYIRGRRSRIARDRRIGEDSATRAIVLRAAIFPASCQAIRSDGSRARKNSRSCCSDQPSRLREDRRHSCR
jgi:hypothetical protein